MEADNGNNSGKLMFDQHRSFLQERMDPDSGLLDKLLANKTISKIEYDDIKDNHPFYRRNVRLLDCIGQNEKYDSLIGALRDTHQTHLVNYLIGNGEHTSEYDSDWPLTDNEISVLDTNRESLVDLVDCNDLLVRLFSAQVINGRQRETISSEPTNHRRNEVLLDIIRRRSIDDYKQVIRCLHESNQSHVAEILDNGGVVVRVHADLGNDNEAYHTEDDIITRFTDILSGKSLGEASRMLNKMNEIGLKVIAAKKGHSVVLYFYCRTAKELMDLHEMNLSWKLRSIIKQVFRQLLLVSSPAEYAEVTVDNLKDVIECALTQQLYRSHIQRLAVVLPTEEYKRCRSYFSDECSIIRAVCDFELKTIGRRTHIELKRALLPLARADHDYSMVLSFKKGDHMMTAAPENIGDAADLWKVEHLGDGRIGYILRKHVVIDYSQENLGLSKRQPSSMTTATSSTSTMNILPLELLDIILQKSYLHCALNIDRLRDESQQFLVTRLAAVDRCWSERLRKRRFKRITWRHLSIAFNKIHQVMFILRSNQSFLEEIMRLPEGVIDQLKLYDCLTDVQSRLLNRQTVTSGKRKLIGRNNSSDFLHVLRSCDETRRSDWFRFFRQTGQKLATKVIDNGGVVIKVNLCGRDTRNLRQVSERLNDLYDKTKLRSDTKERAINKLFDNGIEIFHFHMDRQTVLYIWCKSHTGQENLRTLCESKAIVDAIDDLTKNTSSAPEPIRSRMIDADIDQFQKTVVACPIFVRFTARLYVNDDEKVVGVTMLRQEICVLCRHNFSSFPPAIHVFENRNQFRLNAKIDIGESVKSPEDIGSSDKENCFFVADSAENCVWKIARQTGDYHKFVDLQSANIYSWPSALSVSCDGQGILILTLRSLDIYGTFRQEGAAQKPPLSVHLPSDIEYPIHAVETSSGHFIILHSLRRDFGETAVPKEKETKAKNRMYVVSKMTRDGRLVVRRYVPQNKGQELSDPCYLALDSDDRVFVADAEDDRVIILDSDLNSARISCPTEDEGKILKMPYKICYDKVERQFIMTGLRSRQCVDIYSIDRK